MQPARRVRAVAGAPVEALVERADELARRWAIALILALPLERIGEFPLESFARHAPRLCAHVVRALQSDADLERIASRANGGREPSPALWLAEVTGARDGQATVEAVEALRGVLWDALQAPSAAAVRSSAGAAARPTRARALPWDTPLRGDRGEARDEPERRRPE